MFEIPDDDVRFWEDLPLDDVTNNNHKPDSEPQAHDKHRQGNRLNIQSLTDVVECPVKQLPNAIEKPVHNARQRTSPPPVCAAATVTPIRQTHGSMRPGGTPVDYATPRQKRKFPGPAGILPKLEQGQSLDTLPAGATNTPKHSTSPKEDVVILSSQTSEDTFSEAPWQTLMADLGSDGVNLMKKFSIAGFMLKAGKKQLLDGKVPLVFAVIETLDCKGSDASVTLRDKSGRMQGTIHRDLLKDYEEEIQTGTVVVLKQVSVISLTNRNHYLNITPTNIVAMYRTRDSQLHRVNFHGSRDSLQSVLSVLERKAHNQLDSSVSSVNQTPDSRLGAMSSGQTTPSSRISAGCMTPVNLARAQNKTPVNRACDLGTPTVTNVRTASRTCGLTMTPGTPTCATKVGPGSHTMHSSTETPNTKTTVGSVYNQTPTGRMDMLRTPSSVRNVAVVANDAATPVRPHNMHNLINSSHRIGPAGDNSVKSTPTLLQARYNRTDNADSHSITTAVRSNERSSNQHCMEAQKYKTVESDKGSEFIAGIHDNEWRFKSPMQSTVTVSIAQGQNSITPSTMDNTPSVPSGPLGSRSCQLQSSAVRAESAIDLLRRNDSNCSNTSNKTITDTTVSKRLSFPACDLRKNNICASSPNSAMTTRTCMQLDAPKSTSKWSFKPRGSSPRVPSTNCASISVNRTPPPEVTVKKAKLDVAAHHQTPTDNLWQDDLSDDLLSQLSDDIF